MQQRSSLRLAGLVVAVAMVAAACAGAGNGRLTGRAAAPTGSLSPDGPTAAAPVATVTGTAPSDQAGSTADAINLLRQVDDLVGQADSSLAADRDATINMGE